MSSSSSGTPPGCSKKGKPVGKPGLDSCKALSKSESPRLFEGTKRTWFVGDTIKRPDCWTGGGSSIGWGTPGLESGERSRLPLRWSSSAVVTAIFCLRRSSSEEVVVGLWSCRRKRQLDA
jgi:hypothetical protein